MKVEELLDSTYNVYRHETGTERIGGRLERLLVRARCLTKYLVL